MQEKILIRIDAPYMCAGVVFSKEGKTIRSAPILKWVKDAETLIKWAKKKNFKIDIMRIR